jgi:hypothetical protein
MSRLLSPALIRTLLTNEHRSLANEHFDPLPMTKLFTPDGGSTWLLSEIDPADHDRAFGLCDLGLGCPELGWVSLRELAMVRGRLGLPIERDRFWTAIKPLSDYAAEARILGRIGC